MTTAVILEAFRLDIDFFLLLEAVERDYQRVLVFVDENNYLIGSYPYSSYERSTYYLHHRTDPKTVKQLQGYGKVTAEAIIEFLKPRFPSIEFHHIVFESLCENGSSPNVEILNRHLAALGLEREEVRLCSLRQWLDFLGYKEARYGFNHSWWYDDCPCCTINPEYLPPVDISERVAGYLKEASALFPLDACAALPRGAD